MIVRVKERDILKSGRLNTRDLALAKAGSKTGRDPYVAGFTSGGARIEVGWDPKRKRHFYLVSGYSQDGSDCQLTPACEGRDTSWD